MLGTLAVGGLSTDQTSQLISARLDREGFIRQAHVSVMVSQFMSRQISVIGQVNKPGKYPLDKASTVVDSLAMAGGIDPTGGDKIILIRRAKEGNKERKIEIDLHAIFQEGESKNIEVLSGDIIYVPRAEVFYVYGEVQHPGMIRLERGMTVLQAISAAGGLTPKGTENGATLKRQDDHGEMQTFDVDLGERMRPNDVLYIRESWF
jgi:polysaccharide export outer membrane protein